MLDLEGSINMNLHRFYRYANHYTIALKFKSIVMYTGTPLKKVQPHIVIHFSSTKQFFCHMTFETHTIITEIKHSQSGSTQKPCT
ncbi:hypothetical protein RIF29_34784 [Crotalaria pallida]|uniref:Uncharacterized protein n=1 Tax=Crotalaria pallida TaxID=3830 RepID=A0AAN9HXK3_CROPI